MSGTANCRHLKWIGLVVLSLLAGCNSLVSSETLDLSGFQVFERHGDIRTGIRGLSRARITAAEDGQYTLEMRRQHRQLDGTWETDTEWSTRDLTSEEISRMRDLFSSILVVHVPIIDSCGPVIIEAEIVGPKPDWYSWDNRSFPGGEEGCGLEQKTYIRQEKIRELEEFLLDLEAAY